ncbi:MAG: glyoxalase [Chloroflexota bacterium]|nr:MAG: glyoxalase [Chloroflexota bacterium]
MKITGSAISLNVADVAASAQFVKTHLHFTESMMVEDKVASLTRDDLGFNLIFLKTGLETFKPQNRAGNAGEGLLVVMIVENIDAEYTRLQKERVPIVTPIETEPWGERYFQMVDPNGIIFQCVQWMTESET